MKTIFTLALSLFITTMFSQNTDFTVDVEEGCRPLTVQFQNTSSQDPGDYFVWEFNDGTPNLIDDNGGTHEYTRPGGYDIIIRHYNYADNEIGYNYVYIRVNGVDSIQTSTGADACIGEKVWFSPYNLGDYSDVYWVIEGDTSGFNHNVSHIFNTAGTYEVKVFVESNTCGWDSVFQDIEITNTATPIVAIENNTNEVCITDEMNFNSRYPAEHLLWDFDDGTTDTLMNVNHIYTTLGGKNVTLTATNICGNSASTSVSLNVRDDIEAYSNFNIDNYGNCPNTPIKFYSFGTGTYSWTFDTIATSSEKGPSVLFPDTGYYQVQLIVSNGCGNSDTSKIDAFHVFYDTSSKPEANINFDINNSNGEDTISICPNQEVSFNNNTYPLQGVDHYWSFGDGDTSVFRSPTHIFSTSSEIMYIAQNQCHGQDTSYLWVNIDGNIYPETFLGVLPDTICPGENVYFIDYNSNTMGGEPIDNNHLYDINFGDGQSLINPTNFTDSLLPIFSHVYEDLGNYTYTFSITNQCGNSLDTSSTIYVLDNAHVPNQYLVFNTTDPNFGGEKACPNDFVLFEAFGGANYEWHFGDGNTDTNRVVYHAYPDTGTYNAFVIITTNCGDTDTVQSLVSVSGNNLPYAYFDIDGNDLCSGDTVRFFRNGGGMSDNSYTYTWLLDGDTIANGREAYYIFDRGGDYNIELSVRNGCGTTNEFRHIYVNSPILSFDVSDNVVIPGENVVFTNTSTNATSYQWDFGDGNTSTQISPTHSYDSYGYYDITLEAINSQGCSQTEIWNNHILVSDIQVIANVTNLPCNGYDMQMNSGSINLSITGGLPPYTMSCQEDDYEYVGWGQQIGVSFAGMPAGTYHIDIEDANGTQITNTYTITEPDSIKMTSIVDSISCYGYSDGEITVNVLGGTPPYSYNWRMDGVSYPNNTNHLSDLSYATYGLFIEDINGCMSANNQAGFEYMWTLYPTTILPFNYFDSGSTCGANDGVITVTQETTHPLSIQWFDSTTGSTSFIGAAANKTNLSAGIYPIIITDDITGCIDSVYVELNNNTPMHIDIEEFSGYVCTGASNGVVNIQVNDGTGNYSYQWSSNVLPSNMIDETFIYHLEAGTYTLTVTDVNTNCELVRLFEINEFEISQLFFTKEDPKCYGDYTGSAEVNPVSTSNNYGTQYNWSNGSTDSVIVNRNAGTYYVTVSNSLGCSSTGSVTLDNPAQMSLDMYLSDVTTYGANNGVISVLVNNGTPYYTWAWESSNYSGNYADNLEPGEYFVTVTDGNSCTAVGSAIISEPAMLNISITANETIFCHGQTYNIEAPYSANYTYSWSTGETTDIISVGASGTYVVTVNDGITIGIDSVTITVVHPYSDEKICMVSVDSTSMYNEIMWNKTENVGITEYKIYKLFGSIYMEIGSQAFDDYSVFVDSSSQPNVHADRYKLSIVDTCGNESDLSPYHQTMYLGISDNTIGGNTIVILDWDEASVNEDAQTIDWYFIYRGNDVVGMTKVDSISGVFTGWNDNNALSSYYYRVAYDVDVSCYPSSLNKTTGGPYNQSVSNIDDYSSGPTDIDEFDNSEEIQIYPNPFFDKTRIYMPEEIANGEYSIKITDISGKRILLDEKVKTKVYTLYRNNLPNGIYFVEITGDKTYRKKLIIN